MSNKKIGSAKLQKIADESLKNRIRELTTKNNDLKKENGKLKTENKTLKQAWNKTETYLKDIHKGKRLEKVLKDVEEDGVFKEEKGIMCPKCHEKELKRLQFKDFYLLVCDNCKHRQRIENGTETAV